MIDLPYPNFAMATSNMNLNNSRRNVHQRAADKPRGHREHVRQKYGRRPKLTRRGWEYCHSEHDKISFPYEDASMPSRKRNLIASAKVRRGAELTRELKDGHNVERMGKSLKRTARTRGREG